MFGVFVHQYVTLHDQKADEVCQQLTSIQEDICARSWRRPKQNCKEEITAVTSPGALNVVGWGPREKIDQQVSIR